MVSLPHNLPLAQRALNYEPMTVFRGCSFLDRDKEGKDMIALLIPHFVSVILSVQKK